MVTGCETAFAASERDWLGVVRLPVVASRRRAQTGSRPISALTSTSTASSAAPTAVSIKRFFFMPAPSFHPCGAPAGTAP